MSMEICKICEEECTPWFHINGHICNDCYHDAKDSKWISVKDRYPLYEKVVILDTTFTNENIMTGYLIPPENRGHINDNWFIGEDLCTRHRGTLSKDQVTHWMTLPKSNKEE